jgi:thiol-disulfide isomerase/thioredoxin
MKNSMSKSVLRALALAAATVLLSSCTATTAQTAPIEPTETTTPTTSEAPTAEQTEEPSSSEAAAPSAGNYIPYASYRASTELYSDTTVVLFFNADWCSTCQTARENFQSSLKEIPADLTLVIVDFEDSLDLRKKHGVTLQHTFVQIDAAGETVAKWSGSVTISQILQNIV